MSAEVLMHCNPSFRDSSIVYCVYFNTQKQSFSKCHQVRKSITTSSFIAELLQMLMTEIN